MKSIGCLASAMLVAAAFVPSAPQAENAPKFAIDAAWPKDLPEGWITGRLGGVCMDAAQDNVYVVNRRDITDEEKETSISAPSIIKFNADGDVVASWGFMQATYNRSGAESDAPA